MATTIPPPSSSGKNDQYTSPSIPVEQSKKERQKQQSRSQTQQAQQNHEKKPTNSTAATASTILRKPLEEEKKQPEIEEYDESLELQKKRLPKIYNLINSKNLVVKNSKMEAYDVQMKAPDSENVLWTALQVTVNPFEQLRPFEADAKEGEKICYMVLQGRGEIMSSELRKKILEGDIFIVEKGVRHNLNNLSEDKPLVVIAHYPGFLDARDIYKPISQKYKKAVESRQKFFAQGAEPTPQPEQKTEIPQAQEDPSRRIAKEMDRKYV